MTFTIDLPSLNPETWAWAGAGAYLVLCYLLIGPWWSRAVYREWTSTWMYRSEAPRAAFGVWAASPVLPLWYVLVRVCWRPLNRLVCGPTVEGK
jgi:hypothetical protein